MKRKSEEVRIKNDTMTITPLGAGNEVGRSCIVITFREKTVMLDCGIHPGKQGLDALPYFDDVDVGDIDLLLVTHFHLDHCGALAYFTEKTAFNAPIYMTRPTRAVMRMLLQDYLRVSNIASEDMLYDTNDLEKCIKKIKTVDYHQHLEHAGIKFEAYNAGHVLGAAMFMLEIDGVRVLYTGDYSREDDRHLMSAELPSVQPDVLICESTYGLQVHQPLVERETRFIETVTEIVQRGGRCLIPVFALGRSQELMLILDEWWQTHPELQNIPIYFSSKLAQKALKFFQSYINYMNDHVKKTNSEKSNPFLLPHINPLLSLDHFEDRGPCVVMAVPGMLQNGVSRSLFERWCTNRLNGVIVAGYCVEGTLAKTILNDPEEIMAMDGRMLPLNCKVEYISFSAHVDSVQTTQFIETLKPKHVILVHGEGNEMGRLAIELRAKHKLWPKELQPVIRMPKNCEPVELIFKREKQAKAIGSLAKQMSTLAEKLKGKQQGAKKEEAMTDEAEEQESEDELTKPVSGVVVGDIHGFTHDLMDPADLPTYTHLCSSQVSQRQHAPFSQNFEVLQYFLEQMYESVEELTVDVGGDGSAQRVNILVVHEAVRITHRPPDRVLLEWSSSPVHDMIADSVIALIMQAQSSPAGIMLGDVGELKTTSPTSAKQQSTPAPAPASAPASASVDEIVPDCTPVVSPRQTGRQAAGASPFKRTASVLARDEEGEDERTALVTYRLLQEHFSCENVTLLPEEGESGSIRVYRQSLEKELEEGKRVEATIDLDEGKITTPAEKEGRNETGEEEQLKQEIHQCMKRITTALLSIA